MHRTVAANSQTIGTLPKQHVDRNLPATPGTFIAAETLNAMQEELVSAIEYAGISIESDPAVDRAAGFIQLKEAIFESQAIDTDALAAGVITDSKVTSVSLSKLINGIMSVSNGSYTYYNDGAYTQADLAIPAVYPRFRHYSSALGAFYREEYSGPLYKGLTISTTELEVYDDTNVLYDNKYNEFDINGIDARWELADNSVNYLLQATIQNGYYHNRNGSAVDNDAVSLNYDGLSFESAGVRMKFMVVEVAASSWTALGGSQYSKEYTFSLDDSTEVLNAQFSFRLISQTATYFKDLNLNVVGLYFLPNGSGSLKAVIIVEGFDPGNGSYDNLYLSIWYNTPL